MSFKYLQVLLTALLFQTGTNAMEPPDDQKSPPEGPGGWRGRHGGHGGKGWHGHGHCRKGDGQGGCGRFRGPGDCRQGGGRWNDKDRVCEVDQSSSTVKPLTAHLSAIIHPSTTYEIQSFVVAPYPAITDMKPGVIANLAEDIGDVAKAGGAIKYTISFKVSGQPKGVTEEGICKIPDDYMSGPVQLRLEHTGAQHGSTDQEFRCFVAFLR